MKQVPDSFPELSLTALPLGESEDFLTTLRQPHQRGLRLRPGVPLERVQAALPGPYAPIPWAAGAYYIDIESVAGTHPLHHAGAFYLQEPSAMAPASVLAARPGERVLDLCAAPGGKATQLAAALGGSGVLIANEMGPARARVLSQNIERMGVRNAIVTSEAPDHLAARWSDWFDAVLVDAPCSGEGMFRRSEAARAEWTPQTPIGCATRQARILAAAAHMVRPGGRLVYATCTFNTMENEETIASFLGERPDFEPMDFALPGVGPSSAGCLRLWPHRLRGEGHFVACLKRQGPPRRQDNPAEADPLPEAIPLFEGLAAPGRLVGTGVSRWLEPLDAPPLDGIRVLRRGLLIGTRPHKTFRPDHALALAFAPDAFRRSHRVDDADAVRYLRGEALESPGAPDGWTAIAYRGLTLGWVKASGGTLKNHLPKGLRRYG